MTMPSTSRNELIKASRRNELIIETGRQIQKDFGEFGLEISFSGKAEIFYEELFEQMKVHVDTIVSNSIDRFMHFLYRIDIDEKQIMFYQQEMSEASYVEVITELIIHRELKKVITRDFFRQQNKSSSNFGIENP